MMAINEEIKTNEQDSNNPNGFSSSTNGLIIQQTNDQNNNNLISTSLFTLQNGSTSQMSSSMQQFNSNLNPNNNNNLILKMNDQLLPSNNSNLNTNMQLATFNNDNWPHSMLKPASRFSISTRRECKSTSDESYTLEIQTDTKQHSLANHCLISPVKNSQFTFNTTNIINFNNNNNNSSSNKNTQHHLHGSAVSKLLNEDWFLTNIKPKLNNGKFGFNPAKHSSKNLFNCCYSLNLNNSSKNTQDHISNGSSSNKQLAHRLNVTPLVHSTGSGANSKDKKSVKRLNYQNNKLFINNLNSKKHCDYNHNKKLFHAVSNNDFGTVSDLLDSNMYDVNCFDDKQRTCLHVASSRGYAEIARLLLQYGSNPNLRDCVNNLPIHLAIIASHVPVVTLLLEAGTDIHSLDLNEKSVLHLAGTRLRWLVNDESNKTSPKLKVEAILIMDMIKEYLKRKKIIDPTNDLDILTNKLENVFNIDDISNITKEFLDKFETDFKL